MFLFPIILTVASSAMYHFMLKQASTRLSPFTLLFWSYAIAAVLCLVGIFATGADVRVSESLKGKMYLPGILALTLIGIEVGYLLSYKGGGQLGKVSMITQLTSIIVMVAIGFFMTKDTLTLTKGLGVATALMSFFLLSR